MINILYSPVLEYDEAKAQCFDEARKKRLSLAGNSQRKNEVFTSGMLIESIRPMNTHVYCKTGGRPAFTSYYDCSVTYRPIPRNFNITHSGGMVFCAYSDLDDVGVDYEPANRKIIDRVTNKLCSPEEITAYKKLDGSVLEQEFLLKLFTRKESLSKLMGIGLSLSFSDITDTGALGNWDKKDFISKISVPESYTGKNCHKNYVVRTIHLENGYLSVAYEYDENKPREEYELNISKYIPE